MSAGARSAHHSAQRHSGTGGFSVTRSPLPTYAARRCAARAVPSPRSTARRRRRPGSRAAGDRKSTRLNSSHVRISYAVFCLKKKKKKQALDQTHIDKNKEKHT